MKTPGQLGRPCRTRWWRNTARASEVRTTFRGALELLHATYIGYHGDAHEWLADNPEFTREMLNRCGYWLFPTAIELPERAAAGETIPFVLTLENRGVAPPYQPYELRVKLSSGSHTWIQPVGRAERWWLPGAPIMVRQELPLSLDLAPGEYQVAFGLFDAAAPMPSLRAGDRPEFMTPHAGRPVELAMKVEFRDDAGYYRVARLEVGPAAAGPEATEFHVSPNGSDLALGTREHPFATPARAVTAVRAQVAAGLERDVRVIFRGGVYALAAPLDFTAADSGTPAHSITYAAAPGEAVVWSGGRSITGWQPAGERRWKAELPEVQAGRWFFRQLTVRDQRAMRARWPNEDGVLRVVTVNQDVNRFTFDRALPGDDLGGEDAELVVYQNWSVSRARVVQSDAGELRHRHRRGLDRPRRHDDDQSREARVSRTRPGVSGSTGRVVLDRRTGQLSYVAGEDEVLAETDAVAPVLTQLVESAAPKNSPCETCASRDCGSNTPTFRCRPSGTPRFKPPTSGPAPMHRPMFSRSPSSACTRRAAGSSAAASPT